MAKRFFYVCAGLLCLALASTSSGAGTSLALGRPAIASRSGEPTLPDSAFDGDTATAWNALARAPQWIEVDLGEDYAITQVDGCVDITPNGDVFHVIEGRTDAGAWHPLGSYSGPSERNAWLRIPCDPIVPVRHVRITTESSPSSVAWFEIRVYAEQPTPAAEPTFGDLKARYRHEREPQGVKRSSNR